MGLRRSTPKAGKSKVQQPDMAILEARKARLGSSENNLGKGGRDGKCQARRKPRGVADDTSCLQQRLALVSAADLFKSFLLAP